MWARSPAQRVRSPKIERSGLERYFGRAAVTPETDAEAYRRLAAGLGADPAATWMVGSSPRSDVNPALAAGLNAVVAPHDQTRRLEHEELASGTGRLLVLERFEQRRDHF